MSRAIICDGCGSVLTEPAPIYNVTFDEGEGPDWIEVHLCEACVPDDLEELMDVQEARKELDS